MSVSGKNKGKTNGPSIPHPLAGQAISGRPSQTYPSWIPAAENPYWRPYAVTNAENNRYLDEDGRA